MSNTPDTDYSQALAKAGCRSAKCRAITGVNAVTLRAWERRYGLIVPHRTAKGHRLFSTDHIQRIQQILLWLNRGVSVSQIKPLLNAQPVDDSVRQRLAGVAANLD
jgi:MerR family transcriptional regulator, light-induced transcriptional regulator